MLPNSDFWAALYVYGAIINNLVNVAIAFLSSSTE